MSRDEAMNTLWTLLHDSERNAEAGDIIHLDDRDREALRLLLVEVDPDGEEA